MGASDETDPGRKAPSRRPVPAAPRPGRAPGSHLVTQLPAAPPRYAPEDPRLVAERAVSELAALHGELRVLEMRWQQRAQDRNDPLTPGLDVAAAELRRLVPARPPSAAAAGVATTITGPGDTGQPAGGAADLLSSKKGGG